MLKPFAKIQLLEVKKVFQFKETERIVLDRFSVSIQEEETTAILGPSGCGKTTLLNLIAGFLKPDSGKVLVEDQEVGGPGSSRAMIFQDDAVFPWLTVKENIEYGLKLSGKESSERNNIVQGLLGDFGLYDEQDKYPAFLSGGQLKRVDIARALANSPEIMLMDEPFGSLDNFTRDRLLHYVSNALISRKTTNILVAHDIEEALWLSDRILVFTSRPATVKLDIRVMFPRPRSSELRFTPEFQNQRKNLIEVLAS